VTFVSAKTPKPFPLHGAQAAETAAALRASLAAESRRQAFLPRHPTSQESPVRHFLCRALEAVLLAPGLRARAWTFCPHPIHAAGCCPRRWVTIALTQKIDADFQHAQRPNAVSVSQPPLKERVNLRRNSTIQSDPPY